MSWPVIVAFPGNACSLTVEVVGLLAWVKVQNFKILNF